MTGAPDLADAVNAALSTERQADALRDTLKGPGLDIPLLAWTHPVARVWETVNVLGHCLRIEAVVTAAALTPDRAAPEPEAAGDVRARLLSGARLTAEMLGHAHGAYSALAGGRLSRELSDGARRASGRAGRTAELTEASARDLYAWLQAVRTRTADGSLPELAGHAQITGALALTLENLAAACQAISGAAGEARTPTGSERAARHAADELRCSRNALCRAGTVVGQAGDVLRNACVVVRTAPAGGAP